jgi:hypothetical protein
MRRSSLAIKCLAVALALPIANAANADVQFLGSLSTGMAGAGLALPMLAYTEHANPALFSYLPKHFNFDAPDIQLYTRGVSINDLQSDFSNVQNGGVSQSTITKLAQTLGNRTVQLGIGADVGFGFGGFVLGASGGALVQGVPNKALIADSNAGVFNNVTSGTVPNVNTADAYDAYGYGYYSIDAAYGAEIPYSKVQTDPRIAAGLRVRFISSYYTHQLANSQLISNEVAAGTINTNAFENFTGSSAGEVNVLNNRGVGADLGLQTAFGPNKNFYGALQVRNILQPSIAFRGTLPADQTLGLVGETTVNPFVTMYDLGAGATLSHNKLNVGVDLADIGNRGNSQELRLGANYDITKIISVQGGYSSLNGFAAGISIYGINLAVSNRIPFTLSTVFRF